MASADEVPTDVVPVKPIMKFNARLLKILPSSDLVSQQAIITKKPSPVPDLPVETITIILASINNTPTLAACALASHTFHDIAIPLLYHTVVLTSSCSNEPEYYLFFHGILEATTANQAARTRKMTYLRNLKELVLYRPPTKGKPLVFSTTLNSTDIFPSLQYIEFSHVKVARYLSLFSRFSSIRHVCIRAFESGRLYDPEMGLVFDEWKDVEMLTFYNWYASDNGGQSVQEAGIPLAWTKLKQITIYPELAPHGVILRIRPHHEHPIPFLYMPNPSQFPFLKKFTVMIPARRGWDHDWRQYQEYVAPLSDEQKALIDLALMETIDDMWP